MATNLSTVFFESTQVVTMTSREIAELTGKHHFHVTTDIEKMLLELGEDVTAFRGIYLDSMNRQQTEYRLDRELTETLLTGYSATLRRKVIARWRELEGSAAASAPTLPTPATERATIAMMVAESAARILRIEGVPLLGYITDVAEQFSPEAARALPSYGANRPAGSVVSANSELTRSLTDLLKIHGVDSSARRVNPLLIAAGILEQKTRPSSKGGIKEFLSVTARGLKYGINQTAKQNQLETSPRFFESRFTAMMAEIGQAI